MMWKLGERLSSKAYIDGLDIPLNSLFSAQNARQCVYIHIAIIRRASNGVANVVVFRFLRMPNNDRLRLMREDREITVSITSQYVQPLLNAKA